MKILVYGAGVIGSIYAAQLAGAGNSVTMLARGRRYDNLKKHGLLLRNVQTGRQTAMPIAVTPTLRITDHYDLIIVAVRLDQIDAVIPVLKANTASPLILFMLNNPNGAPHLSHELSEKHILLGFPGVGGISRNDGIDYLQIIQQKTTIGEINGIKSPCLKKIKALFEHAHCKVKVSDNMPAWLKIHAVFITCISAAILEQNGDSISLSKKKDRVTNMVQSIREGFTACRALGLPIVPKNLNTLIMRLPQWFAVLYWQHALKGSTGRLAIAPHATAAKNEMQLLAKQVLSMLKSSPIKTPNLDRLMNGLLNL